MPETWYHPSNSSIAPFKRCYNDDTQQGLFDDSIPPVNSCYNKDTTQGVFDTGSIYDSRTRIMALDDNVEDDDNLWDCSPMVSDDKDGGAASMIA
jgi:hypothetical protein